MKTACQNCKWWQVKKYHDQSVIQANIVQPEDSDTFELMTLPFEVRHCTHPKLLFCERPIERDGFAVADGSTYMANLITGPDFSCSQHEPL